MPARQLRATGSVIGIDVGVANLVANSDGELISNPRPAPPGPPPPRLPEAKRDKARRRPGSIRYRRAGSTVGRITAKEARTRQHHAHKVSRRLVDTYDVICLDDLRIANRVRTARDTVDAPGTQMAQNAALNRAVLDSR